MFPTAPTLSPLVHFPSQPSGTLVGVLSTTDANCCDTISYSIVGGADAADFSISGSNLMTAALLPSTTLIVTVKVSDGAGGSATSTFNILVGERVFETFVCLERVT